MRIDRGKKQGGRFTLEVYVFTFLTLISFLMLFFSTRSFVVDFKDLGLSFFSGIRNGIYQASSFVSRTVLSVQELAKLRREYTELTKRLTEYERMERSDAEIRQENRRLREQLGFSETLDYKSIPAAIIGWDPDNLYSSFVINQGRHGGVAKDMPVIAYQDGVRALVGKVIQTGQFESLVMPLYDTTSFIASRSSESRYMGITEGQGSPEAPLLMRFIQKRVRNEINYGDVIVTSGMRDKKGTYPPGIAIGRVSKVLYQENEISMSVEVEPAIDFSRLEYVVVIDADSFRGPKQEEFNEVGELDG